MPPRKRRPSVSLILFSDFFPYLTIFSSNKVPISPKRNNGGISILQVRPLAANNTLPDSGLAQSAFTPSKRSTNRGLRRTPEEKRARAAEYKREYRKRMSPEQKRVYAIKENERRRRRRIRMLEQALLSKQAGGVESACFKMEVDGE